MNTTQEKRFQALAKKELKGDATAAEQEELRALVEESSEFREEWGEMKRNTAMVRELLMLLQDVREPVADVLPKTAEALERQIEALPHTTGQLSLGLHEQAPVAPPRRKRAKE
jgi:hypothetical protein